MFAATDTKASPWVVIKSDDKKRARLNCMRYVLRSFEYQPDVAQRVAKPDPKLIGAAKNSTPRAKSGSEEARSGSDIRLATLLFGAPDR